MTTTDSPPPPPSSSRAEGPKVLLLEPFYTGSHKALIDLLHRNLANDCQLYTMRGVKWPWRSRTAALHYSQAIDRPLPADLRTVFATSVLNLAELAALRPDIGRLRKVLYFHENQLIYPRQAMKERDFQHGYNEITSCLVADLVLFNSGYNLDSFLNSIKTFFKLMPDYRPVNLEAQIRPKCRVLRYPIDFSQMKGERSARPTGAPMHIIWAHRWEHDKGPETLFQALIRLKEDNLPFEVSVIGECFTEVPAIFHSVRPLLEGHIRRWGFVEDRSEYIKLLQSGDLVLSTALHEFYGVAMLEAAYCGCFPLCPRRLVYPEIFPGRRSFLFFSCH